MTSYSGRSVGDVLLTIGKIDVPSNIQTLVEAMWRLDEPSCVQTSIQARYRRNVPSNIQTRYVGEVYNMQYSDLSKYRR